MRHISLSSLLALCLVLTANTTLMAQPTNRSAVGVDGCPVNSVASNTAGTFLVAACETVFGIYYSVDGGASWKIPQSSTAENTTTRKVIILNGYVYAITGNVVRAAAIPADPSPSTEWAPTWLGTGMGPFVQDLSSYGNFVLAAVSERISQAPEDYYNFTSSIKVYNAVSQTVVTTATLPTALTETARSVAASATHLYAIGATSLYRATFDSTTGSVGSWTDISSNPGLPGPSYARVFVVPESGTVYVPLGATLYVSVDNGDNFSPVAFGATLNDLKAGAAFLGSTQLLGANLSNDGGSTWSTLSDGEVSGAPNAQIEDGAAYLSPSSAEIAIVSTQVGLARTTNLLTNGGTPDWTNASKGLRGVQSLAVSRISNDVDKAILGTPAGLALTKNFTSSTQVWNYPLCPSGGCAQFSSVAFDAADSTVAYAIGNTLQRLSVDFTSDPPALTFSDFGPPSLSSKFVKSYSFLPTTIVLSDETNGGLVFVNKSDGSVQSTALAGKQISAFVALDANTMFAGIGFHAVSPDAADRGIYRSVDGGSTWTELTDGDLSALIYPSNFAYDAQRDILYMSTYSDYNEQTFDPELPKGSVYTLTGALAGMTDWKRPENPIMTSANFAIDALAVDAESGEVFAAGVGRIFSSTDSGLNFSLLYTTSPIESIYFLEADLVQALPDSQLSTKSSTVTKVLAGMTSGYYRFVPGTGTGGASNARCSLTTTARCSSARGVAKGKSCVLTASLVNADTLEPYKKRSINFQRRSKTRKAWSTFKTDKTNSKGARTVSVLVAENGSYRITSKSPGCKSSVLRIKRRK